MSRKKENTDAILKEFWRSNEHFADLFNTVVFEGEKILFPNALEEMDTEMTTSFIKGSRDLIKKVAYGIEFVIVGVENQKKGTLCNPTANNVI